MIEKAITLLKIVQWNARIINNKTLEFQKFLSTNDISIAIIIETWLNNNKELKFSNYNTVRQDRSDGKGGIAVLIKKDIAYRIMKTSNSRNTKETQYVILKINNVYIIAIYIPPNYITNKQYWKNIFKSIADPYIICGDFNIHHNSWGSPYTTREGEILYEFMQENDIICLNNGQPTRLNTPSQQPTAPDLTCSIAIRPQLTWQIFPDNTGLQKKKNFQLHEIFLLNYMF